MIFGLTQARSLGWRTYHRSYNRVHDVLARLSGACNASTWDGVEYAGGYSHWRCMKARGHESVHRFQNYVWAGPPATVEYDPLPVTGGSDLAARELPFRHITGKRYMIDSLRRTRLRRRAAEQARARTFAGRR